MEQLTGLGAGGVVIIAVIMLLRELKPFISRNSKPQSQDKAEILHSIERLNDAQTDRDGVMFGKMDVQTKVLNSIDTTQKLICQKFDRLNGRRD